MKISPDTCLCEGREMTLGADEGKHPSDDGMGWLLLSPQAVPERWRARASGVALVPLLPGEIDELLQALPEGDGGENEFLGLIAAGLSTDAIASRLGITRRSVERRMARLRERLGVETNAELAVHLSRRGL